MASGNDMKAHNATYVSFLGMLKWTLPLIALVTIVVIALIA
ncbi:aa3-type cytochrome c oxidase subunit IV [Novosphingobium sp. MW5]|nr:aa3-type cytochrome c oxidase subunit IV [Novosphingobium sp. MW5]